MFSCILNVSPPPPAALTPTPTYGHRYFSLPQPAFPPSNSSYITPPIYPPLSFFACTRLSLSQTLDEGHVPTARNQPDGARDVEFKDMVKKYLTTPPPATNPFLPPPATLAPTPTYSLHPPAKA
ncbi:hypothetical protein C8R48DRAFT_773073 [Suillus tomentosus]|nr:hypothetical protein C8R48DRAFT_773073 [Suillus tomentosus]